MSEKAVTPEAAGEGDKAGTESLNWTVRLSDREPYKRWAVVATAAVAALAGLVLMQSVLFALLGVAVILAATTDYWLPIRYRVDHEGCSLRCGLSVSSIEWVDVKRVILDEAGAKISPLAESGRLGPFRGVYLRFAGNREQVVEALERFGGGDVRYVGPGTNGGGDAESHSEGGPRDPEAQDGDAGRADAGDA